MKGRRAMAVATGSILTVGILFAAVGFAPSATPAGPAGCSDMAREARSDEVYNTTYDPENNIVWADGPNGKSYRLDPSDASCQEPGMAKKLIEEALSINEITVDGSCQYMREFLASGKTEARGRKVNRTAGQRFVDAECAGR